MISSADWEAIEEIATLLSVALRSPYPFFAGYVCHAAKWRIGQIEDATIRDRASELETAVYRIRRGAADE